MKRNVPPIHMKVNARWRRNWISQTFAIMTHIVTLIFLASGCAEMKGNYTPPKPSLPDAWSGSKNDPASSKDADNMTLSNWWTMFQDSVLTDLVEQAIERNTDVRSAKAALREARARREMEKSAFLPTLGASASASGSRTKSDDGNVATKDLYKAGFDASWEIDVFGGTRRSVDAAGARLEASMESLRDVYVSIAAEVAMNYTDLRTCQARLKIAERNLNIQTETYDIAKWRAEAGLTTELDVEQARYALEQTRESIPSLNTGLTQVKNRLAVLLGKNLSSLNDILAEKKAIPVAPIMAAVGVPADMVRRRPDVRRAERLLAAETANTGAAKAARYPSFTLSGSMGLESLKLTDLFTAGTWITSVASNVGYKVFDAGRIRQSIAAQNAVQEQALIEYESSVLGAIEEVENALVAFAEEKVRHESLVKASQSAEKAVEMVTIQYNSGQKDFQVLLEAQRSLMSLQDQVASSEGAVTQDMIRLYKALGGGWTTKNPVRDTIDE